MEETWTRLGSRTYWLFLFQKVSVAAIFLVLAILFTIGRSLTSIPAQVTPYLGIAGAVCFVIFFIAIVVSALSAWFEYRSHAYCLTDTALKVRQGILSKQEIAIPYRQIQNVDIERSVSEQMLGLSRLVILTAGHDDADQTDHAEGILPAMEKNSASALQADLLKRADVEKVFQVNK